MDMYIRFMANERMDFNGRDGYPAAMVLVWIMNALADEGGEQIIFGKPIEIIDIATAGAEGRLLSQLPPPSTLGLTNWLSPGQSYGSFEKYDDGAIVYIETDHKYVYVVADSERAQKAMRSAEEKLGMRVAS
jgi:hypothetical protein